jgi:hypothetical protein
MHLDLAEDPNENPRPIRLGRNYLIELLNIYKHAGVNHLFFALFDSERPADEVISGAGGVCGTTLSCGSEVDVLTAPKLPGI